MKTPARSLLKMVSYRICASLLTVALVFVFSRQANLAAAVGSADLFVKLAFYFAHERAWNAIKYGRL